MTILAGIIITVIVYIVSKQLYKKWNIVVFSPMFTSFIALIIILSVFRIPYATYDQGGKWFTFMLGPATVAFAVPLHKNFSLLKQYAVPLISSIIAGSLTALLSTVLLAEGLHMTGLVVDSLAPRSITTPVAMDVSHMIGGQPVLTAAFVILTALCGLLVNPIIIALFKIHSPLAKGTLLGVGAHGIGTAKAFELGSIEGTVSSLSMILAAGATLILAPIIMPLLLHM